MTYWIMTCRRTLETDAVYTCAECSLQMPPCDEYLTAHDCDDDIECDFCPPSTNP